MTRLMLVAAALAILVLAGMAAAAMPPVPYFSQCDSRWGSDKLGGDGPTICSQGCALTSTAHFFLDYANDGVSDTNATFGVIGDIPVVGDWDGDGVDNSGGSADQNVAFGEPDDLQVIGDRDGDGDDNIGVYRPSSGEFFMDATLPEVLPPKTIYVDDKFSDDPSEHRWDTIQEGVDDAADGDTVIVYAGEYVENVDVDKRITLIGAGADVVTVTAANAEDHVFEVTADRVNISGFAVSGATDYMDGIHLNNANHCSISDNIASNNYHGIYLWNYSNNSTLQSNTASNNDYGIYLYSSNNNTLQNNTMSGNMRNFGVDGTDLSHYIHNIDASNTVDEKPIYYWVGQQDKEIPDDAGFVGVVNSTNIMVKDLSLTNNHAGVLFICTGNSKVENVTASKNDFGILIGYSSNNTLQNNTANSNNTVGIAMAYSNNNMLQSNNASETVHGIFLMYSSNNTLQNNTANLNNGYGIWLGYSSDNNTLTNNTASNNEVSIILDDSNNNTLTDNNASKNDFGILIGYSSNNNTPHHNNLLDNTQNAYDTGTNQWDSGSEGNYYSDYNGTDPDGDGIGNDPHPIPGGTSIDRFPLMQPWAATTPQKGDLNGDDRITPADAAIALAFAAGGSASCDPSMLAAADVSGDGKVTSLDALMILQAATGVVDSL